MSYRYDYTKSMIMKLFLAEPDRNGGSRVYCDFGQALEIIKTVDAVTLGVHKIIYLVGWQYLGHDDKYPAFFKVNEYLKRREDESALESLLWLIEPGEKYNTTVSVHINLSDAYENSPIFADYVVNKALIRNKNGKAAKIESYNGLPCYKIDYKAEWTSGLFKKRAEKLLNLLPLQKIGTVHIDDFQCYVNNSPKVSAYEMQYYRKKIIDWFSERGIDVTTEFTYREGALTGIGYGKVVRDILKSFYPIDLLGKVPAVWHVDKLTGEEIMKYYPHVYCGGKLSNKKYADALYYNIQCEEIWKNSTDPQIWLGEFIRQFALINVPFFYLSSKIKKNYTENKNGVTVEFSDGTISDGAAGTIKIASRTLKEKDFVCLPIFWQENSYIAYSETNRNATLFVRGREASVYAVTANGLVFIEKANILNEKITAELQGKTLYIIKT